MFQLLTTLFAAATLLAVGAAPVPTNVSAAETADDAGVFNLNLIGMEKVMPVPSGGGGHRIFVPLWGDCRIDLSEGAFGVEDGNCTDDGTSAFRLPNPNPEDDGVSAYRVYVRALGKPGGSAVFQSCVEDGDGTWCGTETVVVARAAGESPQMDISKEALTVCHDRDGDGTYDREQIFDDENADYYWNYQNSGLRLAQLRFYPNTPTDMSGPCPAV